MFSKKSKRLSAALLGAFAVLAGGLGLAAPAHAAGQQFTMPQDIRAEGTFVSLKFRTWLAAPVIVEVAKTKLGANDFYPASANAKYVYPPGTTDFDVKVTGLKPNTQYYATIHAYDPTTGGWYHDKDYSLLTKHRKVQIQLAGVQIHNDGDDACGEIDEYFGIAGGEPLSSLDWQFSQPKYLERCDGQYLSLNGMTNQYGGANVSPLIEFKTDTASLFSDVVDDDTWFGCSAPNDFCNDTAVGSTKLAVTPLDGVNGTQESFTKAFNIRMQGKNSAHANDLDATLGGWLTVSYQR